MVAITGQLSSPGPVIGAVDDARWDSYVEEHRDRSAYHYAGWARLIARAFNHEAVLLAATADGIVVGVLPLIVMRSLVFGRYVVSLPYLNEGGVLADGAVVEEALVEAAIGVARNANADYLELRHMRRHSERLVERRHKVAMSLG